VKYIKPFLFIFLSIFLVLSVNADLFASLVYEYKIPDVTVVFSNNLSVSAERQKEIADKIAGVSSNIPPEASPNNIICTLFGHDLSPQVTVTATHHKVRLYVPRCLMEVYHVVYCNRCNYTEQNLENSFYIDCCPED